MKVLVVGGAGYIGGALTDVLMANDVEFTVYDSLFYEDLYLKPVDLMVDDVRDYLKLNSVIHDYDVVVWLAAVVGDGACAVNPELTKAVNQDSVQWLADNYDGKIIFMSTCSVYGANNSLNLNETSPTNPLSLYATTKCNCESILKDKDSIIFRLGTVHGLGDRYSRLRLDLVVNILTMKASLGKPLTVFGGTQWRPIIHVRDIAEALYLTIKGERGWGKLKGIYNLSSENMMIRNLATEIQNVISDTNVKYVDKKFEDLRNYHVTSEKLKKITKWEPKITLRETIVELQKMFESKRIKDVDTSVYNNEQYMKGIQ